MKFNQEYFIDVYSDANALLQQHHREVTIFEGLPLEIDVDKYLTSEEFGALKVFTIRNEQKLIGYASFFLYKHSHHLNTLHATQDTVYITPQERGIGLEFSLYCDEQLRLAGATHIHRGMPIGGHFGKKLEDAGYQAKETIYIRSLI